MRIDAHAHVLPAAFLEEADRHGGIGWPGPVPGYADCIAVMDRYATDACITSLPVPLAFGGALDAARVRTLARECNTVYAELVARAPRRLGALACLPLPDVGAALAEAEYALDELRLDGVVLLTSYDGKYLGNDSFRELFDELHRRSAYVFVHPAATTDPLGLPFGPFLTELPLETTRAVVDLLFAGTFARCPDIRFQFAHLGGTTPFLAPRIDEAIARFPQLRDAAPDGSGHLRQAFWDTGLSTGAAPLSAARAAVGLERIVFGTDWPFDVVRPREGHDPAPGLDALGTHRATVEGAAVALVPRLGSA
ncbi:MAG: amidohydrolase 2 [Conexibacter sp.]|nr:amidohydrolase 2 [Conexibacter sp.]